MIDGREIVYRELCIRKEIKIIEAELLPENVHMLVEILLKMRVSEFAGVLKGRKWTYDT